jgi:DNA-binding FadR family transcriptional regulator
VPGNTRASGTRPPTPGRSLSKSHSRVICAVWNEMMFHGVCDLPRDEIAIRAGVSRGSVRSALARAVKLGLMEIEERRSPTAPSRTNVVRMKRA